LFRDANNHPVALELRDSYRRILGHSSSLRLDKIRAARLIPYIGIYPAFAMKRLLLSFLLLAACVASGAEAGADYKRTEDVIYGRKFGTALTLDVVQPAKTYGIGIVFMVSGGFFSRHASINPGSY